MGLYKWASNSGRSCRASFLLDCFELSRDVREPDMRASPYDLSVLGYEPVRIETPEGKSEYVAAQRAFAERAAGLRDRLMELCSDIVDQEYRPIGPSC